MTAVGEDPRKVWLVVATDEGEHDVALHTTGVTAAGPAIAALCAHLGLDASGLRLRIDRLGTVVAGDAPLPPLRHGDRVTLTRSDDAIRPASPRGAVIELVVRGGPLNGTRVPLPNGDSVIGRGSGSDVTLADPALSRAHLRVTVDGERVTVADAGSTNGTFIAGRPLTTSRVVARGDVVEAGTSLLTFEKTVPRGAPAEVANGVTVPFNRPPRVHAVPPPTVHELDAPP
ncbi:MAG: FHA domain-containing protein, partial [Actinomycetota bacterium]